ncbi:MAG: four helix bundle protein, partial [Candidatus Falkowbacteria bacterium]|nr:four helix bundle protein [Candidatus Falkowbacteria bacterium]
LELVLLAKYSNPENKPILINRAITKFDSVKFFLNILWRTKALDNKKYLNLSNLLAEIGKMLGGWKKSF